MKNRFEKIVGFIKELYPQEKAVPLHAPRFIGNEKKYLANCIDSTFVSYVGEYVTKFEEMIQKTTGAKYAIAMVNGTAALQMTLMGLGISSGDEVITQALTFVATANAIKHCGGEPVFIDVDKDTLGMSPDSLEQFLNEFAEVREGICHNKRTGRRMNICIPMHTFGHPLRIEEIVSICQRFNIRVVEDAAESLGSYYQGRHTGNFGVASILSFNGNKIITTGGGGMVITNDEHIANRIRHISTTAKRKHPWEFYHDEVGYNLRLPNVNAAVGCAQMESLEKFLSSKRELANIYDRFFSQEGITCVKARAGALSNYWLNAILLQDRNEQREFLQYSNENGVQTRPVWQLMTELPMYKNCQATELDNARWLEERLVNLPSSVRV